MKSLEIRKKFFDFFAHRGHDIVPSSPLIPAQDPTLLFANAGMNQFKDVFLGKEKRSYVRAVSIQKCMRAGGKHNDLDNVGFTKRHLTFFEMMGNFSFGDYFKKEAIEFAWEFLTQEMLLSPDRLVVSVFEKDDESYDLWHTHMRVPREKIYRLGTSENFWQMGETGPCGPCTEIHIDRGASVGCRRKECNPSCSCERFMEIWNLVFMQFDRQPDGTDKKLARPGVDTGMGFERLAAVMQQVESVFQTDLFMPLIQEIEKLTAVPYRQQPPETKAAFHVLADHIRASCFAIADGATPSNEGRGYVLRKIIRRAALFERKLTKKTIFSQLVRPLIQLMGPWYPELIHNETFITTMLHNEIEKFALNLERGEPILEDIIASSLETKTISGLDAFRLYDTFGFPIELVIARAKEKGFTVDLSGFEQEMNKQREQSRKKETEEITVVLPEQVRTEFTGYWERKNFNLVVTSPIVALITHNESVANVSRGQSVWVIAKESPFFAESGGQVSDTGKIIVHDQEVAVEQMQKIGGAIAALITAPRDITVGDAVTQIVNERERENTMKNHTATHLLQAALVAVLGKHVKQAGSLVTPEYARFDFNHSQALSSDQIQQIENRVNEQIMANIPVHIFETTYEEALKKGVTAIFGEKYDPARVRVIDIPGFSAELCGGTHVRATGDIGVFKIIDVSALSAGTRRIVAQTGPAAVALFQETFSSIKMLSQEFKVQTSQIHEAIEKQRLTIKEQQQTIKQLKNELLTSRMKSWREDISEINTIPYLVLSLSDYSASELREIATSLMKQKPGLYIVLSSVDHRTFFVATVDKLYREKIKLSSLGTWLKENFGLSGGGSDLLLQGGGPEIPESCKQSIIQWVKENI